MSETDNFNSSDEYEPSKNIKSIPTVYYIFGLLCGVIVLFVGLIVYSIATSTIDTEIIAGSIPISSEWLEITPQAPLKAKNRTQYISLKIDGFRDIVHNDWSQLELMDGTIITPEVQLLDEYGNTYNLKSQLIDYAGVGFSKDFDIVIGSKFPKDRVYTKIRIRSDKTFRCSKIVWHCFTGK